MVRYYFYIDSSGQQKGPYTLELLIKEGILSETLVWHEQLTDWQQAGFIEEINEILNPKTTKDNGALTPPPTPQKEAEQFSSLYDKISSGEYSYKDREKEREVIIIERPKRWIIESVIISIFFLPMGLIALIFALQSDSKWRQKEYNEARALSKKAGLLVKIAAIIIIALPILFVFFLIIAGNTFVAFSEYL
ncbi:MAG: CD225/dispanin family protein [Rikenellaceae bacterium]